MAYVSQPPNGWGTKVDWHTFLHTYTTLLDTNGDVKVVQTLLRHGSAKVNLDVYA